MKFGRKVALFTALIFLFINTALAAIDLAPGIFVMDPNAPDTLILNGNKLKFANSDLPLKFLDSLRNSKVGTFTVKPTTVFNIPVHPRYSWVIHGETITITVAAADAASQTLTLGFAGSRVLPPSHTSIPSGGISATNDEVTVINPVLNQLHKLSFLNGKGPSILQAALGGAGFGHFVINRADTILKTTAARAGPNPPASAAVPRDAAFEFSYPISGTDVIISVVKQANSDQVGISVTLRKQTSLEIYGGMFLDIAVAPLSVGIIAVVLFVGASYLHLSIDREGYQLGKEASSLPDWFKDWLADGGDLDDELGEYDLTGMEELPGPSGGGRALPGRKSGISPSTEDESALPGSETTDAFGMSLAAILVMSLLL